MNSQTCHGKLETGCGQLRMADSGGFWRPRDSTVAVLHNSWHSLKFELDITYEMLLWYLAPAGTQISAVQTSPRVRALFHPCRTWSEPPSSHYHIPVPNAVSRYVCLWLHQKNKVLFSSSASPYIAKPLHRPFYPSLVVFHLFSPPRRHKSTWDHHSQFFRSLTFSLHILLTPSHQATNRLKCLTKYNNQILPWPSFPCSPPLCLSSQPSVWKSSLCFLCPLSSLLAW